MPTEKYSIQPEDPEGYLKSKLEIEYLSSEELEEQRKNIYISEFIVDSEEFMPPSSMKCIQHFQDIEMQFNRSLTKEGEMPDGVYLFLEKLKGKGVKYGSMIISNLVISRENEEISNQESLIPQGYTVIVTPDYRDTTETNLHVINLREILSPMGVISLFHETAHAEIYESLSKEDKKSHYWSTLFVHGNSGRGAGEMLATALKKERDAWALAIKRMKPLIGEKEGEGLVTKDVLLKYIHKDCLQSYGEVIAMKLGIEIDKIVAEELPIKN